MEQNGIVTEQSSRSFEDAVQFLKDTLAKKGITLFAVIDHSGEAQKVGLDMPPTKLLIFGDPKLGTPVMLASPGSAIDLPLKILVAQADDGTTRLSYNTAAYLQTRHGIPEELSKVLAAAASLANAAK